MKRVLRAAVILVMAAMIVGCHEPALPTNVDLSIPKTNSPAIEPTVRIAQPPPVAVAETKPAATIEATPEPPPPAPVDPWVGAGKSAILDEIEVELAEVQLKSPKYLPYGKTSPVPAPGNNAIVRVRIRNHSKNRLINFSTWGTSDTDLGRGGRGILKDEHDNQFLRMSPPDLSKWFGMREGASIAPGGSHVDLLIFDAPIKASTELRLRLPAENIGREGDIFLKWNVTDMQK